MEFKENRIKSTIEHLYIWKTFKLESIEGFLYIETGYTENNIAPAETEQWQEWNNEIKLSGAEKHFWFHKKFKTPEIERENLELYFRLITGKEDAWSAKNPQGMVFLNGEIIQALDTNHYEILLEYGKEYDMYIYFYMGSFDDAIEFQPYLMWLDKPVEKLYYDMLVPFNGAICFEKYDKRYTDVMKELTIASLKLDLREIRSEAFYESVEEATQYLKGNFYDKLCSADAPIVSCIGHTHIDVAWLWTLAQTKEKAQRSFSTVLNLMKQYPEYRFMSSQPQLYKYVKQYAPILYEQIKERVKEGRWEVEGAMWLEADCNLSSGESLIRQIMFGKKFIKDEFDVDSKVLWLPDVFGYSAALPQIMDKCGVDTFVTSKISWSDTNTMPYDTFVWEGIDGTKIFTYFLTAQDHINGMKPYRNTTYVSEINAKHILGTWERYQQKEFNDETIVTFGFGDGGGGPTKDMLEQQRRLSYGLPGIPKTQISFVKEFLDRVRTKFFENAEKLHKVPKWVGELYLEYHRGTYTSMAKNKKNNRKSELLYQTLEGLSSICNVILNKEYPQKKINENWEIILLNQFHDILPGSSIFEVYEDSDSDYLKVISEGNEILEDAFEALAENIKTDGGLLVYNPHSWTCSDVVKVNGEYIFAEDIPAFGWKVVRKNERQSSISVYENVIENKYFTVKFDNGNIISIYDKTRERELIEQGKLANQFVMYEDYPLAHDAWDIDAHHLEKTWNVECVKSVKVIDEGVRAGFEIVKTFGKSKFVQKIYLYEGIRRIDFETEADWYEDHILLKVNFPLNIHTSKATYEIQFGNIERPTHRNTDWDAAKFEVCAHKWADMSEDDYGVALLNDCKFGHSALGNLLSLTLLKAAGRPNPKADRGHHTFKYSLYPHEGNIGMSDIVKEAYKFNIPMLAKEVNKQDGRLNDVFSFVSCENNNVIIETVKKSEEGNDTVIRMYQSANKNDVISLNFGVDIAKIYLCDMLENELSEIAVENNSAKIKVKPFEIITLKVVSM